VSVVLDSSAVLALLWDEPGSNKVANVWEDAVISSVNAAEVVAKIIDRGAHPEQAADLFLSLALRVIAFDTEMAMLCGQLRQETRALGLSLGDRACLALGLAQRAEILTADSAWAGIDADILITVIR